MSFELATGTAAATLDGTERLAVLQGGAARGATVSQVKNFVGSTTLTGDVAGAGSGGISTTITPHAVSFAKFVPAPSAGLVGANASGDYQHITIGAGLTLTSGVLAATGGGAGGVTDGTKADIVVSGSGSLWTVGAHAITFAKHVAAPSAGIVGANAAGDYQHVTIGTGLSLSSGVLSCTVTGGGGGVTDGTKADITISGSGTIYTIGANVVGFSKFAAAPSAGIVGASATGNYQHITLGSGLAFSGSTLTATASNSIATRTALAALTGMAAGDVRDLTETGREGRFKYSTANLSTQVTNDPNQGVYVAPSSATTGASGAWVRVWQDSLNAKWFGATGDGTTNDLATCQAAVNFAVSVLAAEIFFPRGVYSFGTGTLSVPAYSAFPLKVVRLRGEGAMQLFGTVGSLTMGTVGTILKTTSTTSTAAVVQVTASSGSFSSYALYVKDMTLRTYDNPLCHGLDAGWAQQLVMDNVQVDTGVYSVSATQPTSTTSTGIITPKNNNAALTELSNVSVSGYYIGIEMNEHAHVSGGNMSGNYNALWYQFGNHASYFNGHLQNNIQNFVIGGSCLFRAEVNLEHATTGWQVTTADIKDVGNLCLRGEIVWSIVKAGVGQDTAFLRNGGANILDRRVGEDGIGYSLFYDTAALSVPSGTDTAISFPITYISDGLVVRSGSNTFLDVTKTGLYELQAPATFVTNGTGIRAVAIMRNGTTLLGRGSATALPSPDTTSVEASSLLVDLTSGDYLQVLVKQTSGAALNLTRDSNYTGLFKAKRLGRSI